ncbi:MAG: DUF6435 family protein [Pseudomonadota bacterium]|nr:DUF6435 family protein [Pseudomonadota bacterium]
MNSQPKQAQDHAGIFNRRSEEKLQKQYEAKLAKALDAQRNGDLRAHGTLMEEAEKIYVEIQALEERK